MIAGNQAIAPDVTQILRAGNKETLPVDNVMPKAGMLAVESAREAIRKLFMERITHAKGLDEVKEFVAVVLPTPMAVLEGIRLGADGTADQAGWGDMLLVDVGGATTDVHSIGFGPPAGENVIKRGLDESYAKRTVEGDLGIRFNAGTILHRVGLEKLADDIKKDFPGILVSGDSLRAYIDHISQKTASVPAEKWHSAADAVLARTAVDLAIARHVGRRERIVAREGEAWVHSGKDLRDTHVLIGTGGVFIHNPFASYILTPGASGDERVQTLRPRNPKLFLDRSYLLYAVGLLARDHAGAALRLFKNYLQPIEHS